MRNGEVHFDDDNDGDRVHTLSLQDRRRRVLHAQYHKQPPYVREPLVYYGRILMFFGRMGSMSR